MFDTSYSRGLLTSATFTPLRWRGRALPTSIMSQIPNATFAQIPWTQEIQDGKSCGLPQTFSVQERWQGKKVVIVSVPGAFTPTCHLNHLPPFIQHLDNLKAKGVDEVVVIAANDPFVMSAWAVSEGARDKVLFAQDINAEFSKALGSVVEAPAGSGFENKDSGFTLDLSTKGMGVRTARYALVVDNLKVVYFGLDPQGLDNSSYEAVLAKL